MDSVAADDQLNDTEHELMETKESESADGSGGGGVGGSLVMRTVRAIGRRIMLRNSLDCVDETDDDNCVEDAAAETLQTTTRHRSTIGNSVFANHANIC